MEPFLIPPLGKHYQDIWDEEDSALPFASSSTTGPPAVNVWDLATGGGGGGGGGRKPSRQLSASTTPAVLSRQRTYVPAVEMVEEDLWDEAKGLGGMSERVGAALVKVDAPPVVEPPQPDEPTGTVTEESKRVRSPAAAAATPQGPVPELQVNGDLVSPPRRKDVKPSAPPSPSRSGGRESMTAKAAYGEEDEVYSWPVRPHRIPSLPPGRNERDVAPAAAAMLEVDVAQLEEGVAREMRLLGLLDAEESVSWTGRAQRARCAEDEGGRR